VSKLKTTLAERPLSFPLGTVGFVIVVGGITAGVGGLVYAGYMCVAGALMLAMLFDL
jgi:hypothetical protein